MNCVITYNL